MPKIGIKFQNGLTSSLSWIGRAALPSSLPDVVTNLITLPDYSTKLNFRVNKPGRLLIAAHTRSALHVLFLCACFREARPELSEGGAA